MPDASTPELVLFVGYPSIGKSTFYKKHFAPKGYVHVNQDTLKSVSKCLALVRESVKKGKSCVVGEINSMKSFVPFELVSLSLLRE